jgi:hypothetical protein
VFYEGTLSASCYVRSTDQILVNGARIDVTVQASSPSSATACYPVPVPFSGVDYLSSVMNTGITYAVYVNGVLAGSAIR